MVWTKPLLYYLMGNMSFTTDLHYSFPARHVQQSTESFVDVPHFVMDELPRRKRSEERSTTVGVSIIIFYSVFLNSILHEWVRKLMLILNLKYFFYFLAIDL